MFSMTEPHPTIKGFHRNKLGNFYGILQAKLMKGNEILEISARMIEGLMKSLAAKDPKHFFQSMNI